MLSPLFKVKQLINGKNLNRKKKNLIRINWNQIQFNK